MGSWQVRDGYRCWGRRRSGPLRWLLCQQRKLGRQIGTRSNQKLCSPILKWDSGRHGSAPPYHPCSTLGQGTRPSPSPYIPSDWCTLIHQGPNLHMVCQQLTMGRFHVKLQGLSVCVLVLGKDPRTSDFLGVFPLSCGQGRILNCSQERP